MSRDLKYSLRFTADDQASAKLEKLNQSAVRGSKDIADQARRTSSEVLRGNDQATRSYEKTAQLQERVTQRTQNQATRMYKDRERLGIRSEDRIRREIALTEAAYRRLAQTGRLSGQEQARAYQQMQTRVAALNKELKATGQSQSALSRAGNIFSGGAQVVGAVAGAGYVMAQPVNRTIDYEQRLAYMSATAYEGEGKEAKLAGIEILRGAISEATKYGGSRDDAADALDLMIASGALPQETAINLLPELQKAAIATQATTSEMGAIAVRAMQNFKITEEEIPLMLDIAAKAGSAGGFEIRDMARWLPELMAAGGTSGMSGLEDFKTLVTAAQASLITAGSTDAGGNNLKNLLMKINSRDTARAAEKIEIAPGKSIDLSGTLAKARGEGKNSLDAFVGIVDSIVGSDNEYQKLATKIQSSENKSSEQMAAMEAQAALLQGSSVGQIIQDQQALLALVGYMNNREYVADVRSQVDSAAGINEENYSVLASTAKNKTEKRDNIMQDAEYTAYKEMASKYGDLALAVSEYAAQYPELTRFMIMAKDALAALALAAGGLAVARGLGGFVFGRGAARGKGITGRGKPSASGNRTGSATRGKGVIPSASVAGTAALFHGIDGALGAANVAMSDMSTEEKNHAYKNIAVDTAVSAGSSWAGAKAGAAVGAAGGPIGVAIGGVIGAIAGPFIADGLISVGSDIVDAVVAWGAKDKNLDESVHKRVDGYSEEDSAYIRAMATSAYAASQTPLASIEELQTMVRLAVEKGVKSGVEMARKTPLALDIKTTVDVQNGNIVATINEINSREARRN
jgi:hypothetical protein